MQSVWLASAAHNVGTSWAIILVLKTLLSAWPYAATSAAVHYGALACLYPVSKASSAVSPRALAFGAMTAVHTACGNLGLQLNGVAVMELFKVTLLPVTMALQYAMYRVRVHRCAVLLGTGIVLTSALACAHDWREQSLSWRGIAVGVVYVCFNAACRVLIKAWTRGGNVSTHDLMREQAPAACVGTALWALLVEQPFLPAGTSWGLLCVSAALAVRVNTTAFALCSKSPSAYALLAPLKTLGIVVLANDWGSGLTRPVCLVAGAVLGAVLVFLGTGEAWDMAYTRPLQITAKPWDAVVLVLASLPAVPLWVCGASAALRWSPKRVQGLVMFAAFGLWRLWPPDDRGERTWSTAMAVAMIVASFSLFACQNALPLLAALCMGTALRWSPFAHCSFVTRMDWGYTPLGLTNQQYILAGMAHETRPGSCWLLPCMLHSMPTGADFELRPYSAAFNFSRLQTSMQGKNVTVVEGLCESPLQKALASVPPQRQVSHGHMFDVGQSADDARARAFWAGHSPTCALQAEARAAAPAKPYAALHARIEDDWFVATQRGWLHCLPACAYKNLTTLLAWARQQPGLRNQTRLYVSAGVRQVSDPGALDLLLRTKRYGSWQLSVARASNLTYLQQAVVDTLVCEGASAFGGTPWSTFSNWVARHSAAQVYSY